MTDPLGVPPQASPEEEKKPEEAPPVNQKAKFYCSYVENNVTQEGLGCPPRCPMKGSVTCPIQPFKEE